MKSKTVTRYTCDFCGKRGYSTGHMRKHEARCTKNPNRICGVCKMLEHEQKPMAELLAILPDPTVYVRKQWWEENEIEVGWDYIEAKTAEALPKLRELAGDCPACIMAALRQRGIPIPLAKGFNFTDEMRDVWTEINNERAEADMASDYP